MGDAIDLPALHPSALGDPPVKADGGENVGFTREEGCPAQVEVLESSLRGGEECWSRPSVETSRWRHFLQGKVLSVPGTRSSVGAPYSTQVQPRQNESSPHV